MMSTYEKLVEHLRHPLRPELVDLPEGPGVRVYCLDCEMTVEIVVGVDHPRDDDWVYFAQQVRATIRSAHLADDPAQPLAVMDRVLDRVVQQVGIARNLDVPICPWCFAARTDGAIVCTNCNHGALLLDWVVALDTEQLPCGHRLQVLEVSEYYPQMWTISPDGSTHDQLMFFEEGEIDWDGGMGAMVLRCGHCWQEYVAPPDASFGWG